MYSSFRGGCSKWSPAITGCCYTTFSFLHKIREVMEKEWQPTPVFLPGKSLDRGAWWTIVHGVARVGHDLATKPTNQQKRIHSPALQCTQETSVRYLNQARGEWFNAILGPGHWDDCAVTSNTHTHWDDSAVTSNTHTHDSAVTSKTHTHTYVSVSLSGQWAICIFTTNLQLSIWVEQPN